MDTSGISSSQSLLPVQGAQGHGHHQLRAKIDSAVADKLGISVDQLRSQLSSGKSLTDVAAANGVSKDDLVSTIAGVLQANGPGQAASATSTTGATGAPDLTELATRIADRVGGRHGHGQGSSAGLRSATATTSAADLVAQLSAVGQGRGASGGSDPDGDGDGGGSFNVRL